EKGHQPAVRDGEAAHIRPAHVPGLVERDAPIAGQHEVRIHIRAIPLSRQTPVTAVDQAKAIRQIQALVRRLVHQADEPRPGSPRSLDRHPASTELPRSKYSRHDAIFPPTRSTMIASCVTPRTPSLRRVTSQSHSIATFVPSAEAKTFKMVTCRSAK